MQGANRKPIDVYNLPSSFGWFSVEQEDAHEFFIKFMDKISEQLEKYDLINVVQNLFKGTTSNTYKLILIIFPVLIMFFVVEVLIYFLGIVDESVLCLSCHAQTHQHLPFLDVPIEILELNSRPVKTVVGKDL